MNDCIGFFDSGVGGISVLHTARRLLPNENFLYYGDNGHAPYGPRPLEEIRRLSEEGIQHLLAHGVKAIVIACNTATSAYAEILRGRLSMPIIGMEPAIKPAQLARHGGDILVLATRATLSLPKFARLMEQYGEAAVPIVGEGLVELVESNQFRSPKAEAALQSLLAPHMHRKIDSIVLGCTHYPFLAPILRRLLPDAEIYDGRLGTCMQLKHLLEQNQLLSDDTPGVVQYHTSGDDQTLALMQSLMKALDTMDA